MGVPSTQYSIQDQIAWQAASEKNTSQGYAQYVALWPEGRFITEAQRRLQLLKEEALWTWASKQNQIFSFEQYLQEYPEGFYSQEAYTQIAALEERMEWDIACNKNTISAYLAFRRSFQGSAFADEAAQRIVSLVKSRDLQRDTKEESTPSSKKDQEKEALERATSLDTVVAYNQFLRDFPASLHLDEVRTRMAQLQQRLTSDYQMLEREVELWDQATRLHSRYAYQEYLNAFPSGKFANLAKGRLLALDQQWRWKHRVIIEERTQVSSGSPSIGGAFVTEESLNAQSQAAMYLGWIWLGGFVLLGGLCVWLASYLLPMTIVVGLAAGAHFVFNRGQRLTRNESFPYLIGGALSAGALVQGLLLQLTNNWQLSMSAAGISLLIATIFLARFFQGLMDKGSKDVKP